MENILYVITARGGSKGIPGKNIKLFHGKPLLYYSIDAARQCTTDENICLSSDCVEIIDTAAAYGLPVPFVRPSELATDTAGSYEVLLHAYKHYKEAGKEYEVLVLLQPTSPLRTGKQIEEAIKLYSREIDMVVSVFKADANPYYNLFEESESGFLNHSKKGNFTRRQDAPDTWQLNGAIYVININSLLQKPLHEFEKLVKYEMDKISSVDIDTPFDWQWAEFLFSKQMIK